MTFFVITLYMTYRQHKSV